MFRVAAIVAVAFTLTQAVAGAHDRWTTMVGTVFTHVAQDSELPNSAFPLAIAQDGTGFLWIGTENGLARWDGYRFRIYTTAAADRTSLPDNVIIALHTDRRGRLWLGTDNAGLARYDSEHDHFVRYPLGSPGALANAISAIVDDGADGLWVASDRGLAHLDVHGRPTSEPFGRVSPRARALLGEPVATVLRDRSGGMWAANANGVVHRARGAADYRTVQFPRGVGNLRVMRMFEDDSGRVWIGTFNHGAFFVDRNSETARPLRETSTVPGFALSVENVPAFVAVGPQALWAATGDGGIVAVDTVTMRTHRIVHDPNVPSSLGNDGVLALFRDRSGLVWVGTTRSLSHCDPSQHALQPVFGPTSETGGLSASNARSLAATSDGRVWAALGRHGVGLLDPAGRRTSRVRVISGERRAIPAQNDISAITESPAGDVYLGGYHGLYRAGTSRGDPTIEPLALPSTVLSRGVRALLFHGGVLWLAAADGLWVRDRAGLVKRILGPGLAPALTDNRIATLEPGPGHSLWIGTENGLNLFDPATRHIERILPRPSDPTALSTGEASTILTDRRGRVWVGTSGGGIDIMERDAHGQPRFSHLGLAQGLPNESVDKLLTDRRGWIWASTDDGIAVIDPATLAIRPLRFAEGDAIAGYWLGSGTATAAGELLFGGIGGLTVVRPELLARWAFAAPIAVTEISVAGKPIPSSRYNGDGASLLPLAITPDANAFTVEFSALDFSAPERNHYAYRLEGFDTGWIDASASRRFAAYTNLPPGDYRLLLRGSNRDGVWNQKVLALPLRVLPAWHQTWLFRFAIILAALALIALVIRGRTELLRRRQSELERQVAARTAELHATQHELERLAYFDTLTALPNRRMFTEYFKKLLVAAPQANRRVGIILLDLDGFKKINDTFGHDVGDAVLIEASSRLSAAVRESDCVARLGGDEFAILLPEIEIAEVERVCGRIIENFVEPMTVRGSTIVTSTSVGFALFPGDGTTQEALYKSADLALYDAKRSGRNTWRSYYPALGT